MFWARGEIFNDLDKFNSLIQQLDINVSDLKGNLADVIERYFTLMAHDHDLKISGFDFSDFSFWAANRKFNAIQNIKFQNFFTSNQLLP